MTTIYAQSSQSAILRSLAAQQPHPMFSRTASQVRADERKAQTMTQPQTRRPSYAEADAAVNALPVGRFALPRTVADGSGNMVNFFKVFETRNGKRIVMLIARGGMDYDEQRLSVVHQIAAARHIAEDVTSARQLYGQRTGTCGDCGRALSNEESLAYGIGPVCRNK